MNCGHNYETERVELLPVIYMIRQDLCLVSVSQVCYGLNPRGGGANLEPGGASAPPLCDALNSMHKTETVNTKTVSRGSHTQRALRRVFETD